MMQTSGAIGATELRERITSIVLPLLPGTRNRLAPDEHLGELGLDSLAAAALTVALEDELSIAVPEGAVLAHDSVDALTTLVAALIEGKAPDRSASLFARMREDSRLPDDVVPGSPYQPQEIRTVLLTGATGFVGSHVLGTLLRDTPVRVVCVVRGGERARVRRALERFGVAAEAFAERVETVDGDLSRPHLGLSAAQFRKLGRSVDAIGHAGADLDWVQGYEGLRSVNVSGTLELLRLACTGTAKPFLFLSSLAVVHATTPAAVLEERSDAVAHLESLPLGYAQTKAVAESLVRQAAERGVPARIVRPALVSGDRSRGISNADDLLSRFLRGCIAMRCVPDLGWTLDCVPVDDVARAIVALGAPAPGAAEVIHLANPRARSWLECALWLRLRGYPVDLEPYERWAERLREEAATPRHPLFPLRSFFLQRIGEGPYLPQRFEDRRRARIESRRSDERLSSIGARFHPLDPTLLARYFDAYVARGEIGAADGESRACTAEDLPTEAVRRALAAGLGGEIGEIRLSRFETEESIVAELTSWRRGRPTGLYRARVVVDGAQREMLIKVKGSDEETLDVGEAVARLCSRRLGEAFHECRNRLGFTDGHRRELGVYGCTDPRFLRHVPAVLAAHADSGRQEWVLALELVGDAVRRPEWTDGTIAVALRGLASLHAVGWPDAAGFGAVDWLAPRRTAAVLGGMTGLWRELARNARPLFESFGGASLVKTHAALAEEAERWGESLELQPACLIHNDLNSRNLFLRGNGRSLRLCAFDWELAAVGAPQRDLVEFLCSVLPFSVSEARARRLVEGFRRRLERETGARVEPDRWFEGVRAALAEFLVDRLSMVAMLDRFRKQGFLQDVVRTWQTLHHHASGW